MRTRLQRLAAGTDFAWDDLVIELAGSTRNWMLGGLAVLTALI